MIQLREARETADYELIAQLADAIWREHYTPIIGEGQVTYMLERFQSADAIGEQVRAGMRYFLLYHEKEPAGYFAYEKRGQELFLSKIYVLHALRGRGLGKSAMQFVADRARQLHCKKIALTVNKFNAGSIASYQRMGFRLGPAIRQDIGGGFIMDDYKMNLDL